MIFFIKSNDMKIMIAQIMSINIQIPFSKKIGVMGLNNTVIIVNAINQNFKLF